MVKTIYCFDSSSISACQKPDFRSKQEKCDPPTRLSITSWIRGSGYESFFMCAFSYQQSMQKHKVPSFFLTNTTMLYQGLWLGHIAPTSRISCRCACTTSTIGGGIHLNLSLNSSSYVTLITCHARSVNLTHMSPVRRYPGTLPGVSRPLPCSWVSKNQNLSNPIAQGVLFSTVLQSPLVYPSGFPG